MHVGHSIGATGTVTRHGSLVAAAGSSHALDRTGIYSLLHQRFAEYALEAAYVAGDNGWTDSDGLAEAVDIALKEWDVSRVRRGSWRTWLAARDDVQLWVEVDRDGDWTLQGAGSSEQAVEAQLDRLRAVLPFTEYSEDDDTVQVTFWAMGGMGPFSYVRRLDATPWTDSSANYPPELRAQLTALMQRGAPDAGGRLMLFDGPPGTGKGLVLDTPILTPTGWRPVGNLVVGDEVIGSNGRPTTVTHIYDRGVQDVYSVSFSDEASIVCDGDHLWNVQSRKVRRTTGNFRTMSVREMLTEPVVDHRDSSRKPYGKHFLPLVSPVQHDKIELPLEPYLLGVLLANGSLSSGMVNFTTNDLEIAERAMTGSPHLSFRENTYEKSTARRWTIARFHPVLKRLGLDMCKSRDKFIPGAYLTADEDSRRLLLAALMDCDGSAGGTRRPSYSTTSPALRDGVIALVRSLGGVAKVHVDERECRAFQVMITLPESPFLLPRKRDNDHHAGRVSRHIAAIEPCGRAETRCIAVDAVDQLYVIDHYLVTHNTHLLRSLAHAWRPWCSVDYIVDADQFFGQAAYMVSTMIMGADYSDRWRLLVLEDAGEFLIPDTKNRASQGLSRLLNLSDGLVGQGLRLMILMTTNEPAEEMYPALTRPGRCMARLTFGQFDQQEATDWLRSRRCEAAVDGPRSLAELYAALGG